MSDAISGPGFLFQVDVGGTYTTVAEVKDITGPDISVDVVDVTNQDSPDNFQEMIPTLKKGGTASFEVNFLPSDATQDSATGVLSFLLGRTKESFQVIIPGTGLSVQFAGYVIKWGPKFPVANVATAAIDIQVTGAVIIATAL
jgi:Lambda phage tail tube protein, TTP